MDIFKYALIARKHNARWAYFDGAAASIAAGATTTNTHSPAADYVLFPIYLIFGSPAASASQDVTIRYDGEAIMNAITPLASNIILPIPLQAVRNAIIVSWTNNDGSASQVAYQIASLEIPRDNVNAFMKEIGV